MGRILKNRTTGFFCFVHFHFLSLFLSRPFPFCKGREASAENFPPFCVYVMCVCPHDVFDIARAFDIVHCVCVHYFFCRILLCVLGPSPLVSIFYSHLPSSDRGDYSEKLLLPICYTASGSAAHPIAWHAHKHAHTAHFSNAAAGCFKTRPWTDS